MLVSIVVPVLDEKENLEPLAQAVDSALLPAWDYELIFVDDGSHDGSLEVLRHLVSGNRRLGYISFSRNFGHQTALKAGIEAARGGCVITMDGDFQHPPALLPSILEAWKPGIEVVATIRNEAPRGSSGRPSFLKRKTSRLFYALANAFSGQRLEPGSADFRLLSRKAADIIVSMRERELFLRGAVPWMGLPTATVTYEAAPRRSGSTKYSFAKMWTLALDGMTSFGVRPLRLASIAGAFISLAGFVYALYALCMRLFTSRTVEGWTSLLVSVLIVGGIQLLCLGLVGEYLGKLFIEAKGRPGYIVKESFLELGRRGESGERNSGTDQ
ncbi:MAG: glycosyltransferase family 2 protein [Spirochaetes bacterium]|nr:glycosyltransferase family 2 protein [Spirochaetota bacterium]